MLTCREIVGEFGARPLYRTLGYFSLIGLLRVHTLLGDYTLALKVMDNIELNPKALFPALLFRLILTIIFRRSSCGSQHATLRLIIM